MFYQNFCGQPRSHQQYRFFKEMQPGKDSFHDKPEQHDKEEAKGPQQSHIHSGSCGSSLYSVHNKNTGQDGIQVCFKNAGNDPPELHLVRV